MEDKRKMLHDILDLVIDINGFEKRDREFTGDKPTVMFNFTGHVCWAELKVYEHGWDGFLDPDVSEYIALDEDGKEDDLRKLINYLEDLKERTNGTPAEL